MKTRNYKIISVLLALTMIVCCFSACGTKKKDDNDATKPSIEPPSTEVLVDLDAVTLPDSGEGETVTNASGEVVTNAGGQAVTLPANTPSTTLPSGSGTGSGGSQLSQQDMVSLLKAAGYIYDPVQDIYYTDLNPWQRHFGFTGGYDAAAGYLNMEYVTFKCDFTYAGKAWRIQCWKGQYALLSGAEMGVYTKDLNSDLSEDFYACASDDNLLEMGFDFYKTTKDYNARNRLFYRPLEYHWWQTGFKFGYCNPTNCVVVMTLYAKDTAMADGIEQGLRNVTDAKGKLNPFYKHGTNLAQGKSNIYERNGNQFKIIWVNAGYTNYEGSLL